MCVFVSEKEIEVSEVFFRSFLEACATEVRLFVGNVIIINHIYRYVLISYCSHERRSVEAINK